MSVEDLRLAKQAFGVRTDKELADVLGISIKGVDKYRARGIPQKLKDIIRKTTIENNNGGDALIPIPILSVQASAGAGIENFEPKIIGEVNVSPLLFKTQQSPKFLRLIEVVGDSMEPTLKDGDLVLIDTSKTGHGQDGVYVIALGGELLVKRIQFEPNGDIRIISDNKRYSEKLYMQDYQIPMQIVGIMIRAIVRA